MKYCSMFILVLAWSMLSITSASFDVTIGATDTHEASPITSRITLALEKLSTNFASTDLIKYQKAITDTYDFYAHMVLMHVRLEDYVESFLNNKLLWSHIVGLAFAFNDYKGSATPDGFTEKNSVFLTEVFRLSCERKLRP
ncbi:hypothetical protein [Candidatus Bodocaedibacter vickermanii]|uniref:Uncharacterized protein n=1 Tax=Candidatus Bodocaedibacter vickermanii TaxID=2741701 RepID=A0A7L9RV06_9PROT|nr:hypothetical protein CPBP_01173 [Candidatus Paracaedibacteraceae bacterium 'Lake Konstanz']